MTRPARDPAEIWHELECHRYDADLACWLELAAGGPGPVLDLGCGSGRVALHLARRGHEVTALDEDPVLLGALRRAAAGLAITVVRADARSFTMPSRFGLIVAPMQLVQILGGQAGRTALLQCVAAHLAPGGVFAAAVAHELEPFGDGDAVALLPDVAEHAGTVYSSRPLAVTVSDREIVLERLREITGAHGERDETLHAITLDALQPEELEAAGAAAGLLPGRRREIPPTNDHAGSTVVLLHG